MQADRREPWDQVLGGWISPLRFFDPEFVLPLLFNRALQRYTKGASRKGPLLRWNNGP